MKYCSDGVFYFDSHVVPFWKESSSLIKEVVPEKKFDDDKKGLYEKVKKQIEEMSVD